MESTHLALERLSAYLEGDLEEGERLAASAHLEGCDTCRQSLSDLSQTLTWMRSLPPLEPPARFVERVMERASREPAGWRALLRGWRLPALVAPLATAGLAFLLFTRTDSRLPEKELLEPETSVALRDRGDSASAGADASSSSLVASGRAEAPPPADVSAPAPAEAPLSGLGSSLSPAAPRTSAARTGPSSVAAVGYGGGGSSLGIGSSGDVDRGVSEASSTGRLAPEEQRSPKGKAEPMKVADEVSNKDTTTVLMKAPSAQPSIGGGMDVSPVASSSAPSAAPSRERAEKKTDAMSSFAPAPPGSASDKRAEDRPSSDSATAAEAGEVSGGNGGGLTRLGAGRRDSEAKGASSQDSVARLTWQTPDAVIRLEKVPGLEGDVQRLVRSLEGRSNPPEAIPGGEIRIKVTLPPGKYDRLVEGLGELTSFGATPPPDPKKSHSNISIEIASGE